MKISACKEEIIYNCVCWTIIPFLVISVNVSDPDSLPAFLVIFVTVFSVLSLFQSFVYFGRSFVFSNEGVEIKFFSYVKFYPWSKISYCECSKNDYTQSWVNELPNPGVILSAKDIPKIRKLSPISCCMFISPFHSVFLSYQNSHTENPPSNYNRWTIGYVIDKEAFMQILEHRNV